MFSLDLWNQKTTYSYIKLRQPPPPKLQDQVTDLSCPSCSSQSSLLSSSSAATSDFISVLRSITCSFNPEFYFLTPKFSFLSSLLVRASSSSFRSISRNRSSRPISEGFGGAIVGNLSPPPRLKLKAVRMC